MDYTHLVLHTVIHTARQWWVFLCPVTPFSVVTSNIQGPAHPSIWYHDITWSRDIQSVAEYTVVTFDYELIPYTLQAGWHTLYPTSWLACWWPFMHWPPMYVWVALKS